MEECWLCSVDRGTHMRTALGVELAVPRATNVTSSCCWELWLQEIPQFWISLFYLSFFLKESSSQGPLWWLRCVTLPWTSMEPQDSAKLEAWWWCSGKNIRPLSHETGVTAIAISAFPRAVVCFAKNYFFLSRNPPPSFLNVFSAWLEQNDVPLFCVCPPLRFLLLGHLQVCLLKIRLQVPSWWM